MGETIRTVDVANSAEPVTTVEVNAISHDELMNLMDAVERECGNGPCLWKIEYPNTEGYSTMWEGSKLELEDLLNGLDEDDTEEDFPAIVIDEDWLRAKFDQWYAEKLRDVGTVVRNQVTIEDEGEELVERCKCCGLWPGDNS